MSAACRCPICDCTRMDRQLDDATSSDLTCMSCLRGRHKYDPEPPRCDACGQKIAEGPQ